MTMNPACVAEVQQAVGRPLRKSELDRIEADLTANMRELARTDPEAWKGMSREQRLVEAGKRAVAAAVKAADLQAQRKASTLVAQAREAERLRTRADAMKGRGHSADAWHQAVAERLRTVDDYITGIRSEIMADVLDSLRAVEPNFIGLFHNAAASREFAKAVMANGEHPDPVMAKAAKAYTDAFERVRLRANAAGADIGKLDYGYLPQPHDVGAVARAGAETWAAKVLPMLDRSRYLDEAGQPMTDDAVLDLLRSAWETIATEGRNKVEPGQFRGVGSRAARFDDAHRAIHFKDGDAYSDYLAEFGRGSMFDAILGHAGAMAKTIGMMEELGASPPTTYRLLKDMAERNEKPGTTVGAASLDMIFDDLNGTTGQPVSAGMAEFWQGFRNLTVAVKLQGNLLSAVTDVPLQVLAAKSGGIPFGKALGSLFAGMGKGKARAAERLAIGMDSVSSEMTRWHFDNMAQGWTGRLANATMRLGLVEQWTNALRRGYGLTLSGVLHDMKGQAWADIEPRVRNIMENTGVTEADWKVWQAAVDVDGRKMLTRDGIRAIPDDAIDAALGGEISATRQELQSQIDELASRNAQESEWLQGRQAKYADALAAAQKEIEAFETGRIRKGVAEIDDLRDRAEMLRAQIELAESQRVLELDAREGRQADRVRGIVADVAAGADAANTLEGRVDPAVRRAMESGYNSGAAAGERIGNLRRRITELEARIRSRTNAVDADVDAKAETVGRRMSRMARELQEWSERSAERVRRRDAVMQRIGSEIEPRLAQARERAKNRATARLLGYIDAESKIAVLSPDIVTRASLRQGIKAGTFGGEMFRNFMLFKSFPTAILVRHLNRLRSIPGGQGKAAYSVAMMTSLTAFGALSLSLVDLASGRDPRDPATPRFWTAAFLRGGGLGIFGDLLYTAMGENMRGGQANWTSLGGPVFGTMMDGLSVTTGNLGAAARGEKVDMGADIVRFARQNTPFVNLWYARAAIDQAFLHDLQEHLSPGYLQRLRKRHRDEFGQEFWWQPGGQFAPERAPDVGSDGE
jgi:hypothetical protein